MRAFLSHSSKDKGYVERVAKLLKPGTFELDSTTFDAGRLNSFVISEALKRSDLFCLFLSEDSVESPYVKFETLFGMEQFSKGNIDRFIVICIDQNSFDHVDDNIKLFSIVRRTISIEASSWLIQGTLLSAASSDTKLSHPFIGRETALRELEIQVTAPDRPPQKALYVSGNFGAGRRALVRKFFQNQYPQVGSSFPTITIEELDGLDEIYRKVISAIRPSATAHELSAYIRTIDPPDIKEKIRQIASLFNSLLSSRECCFVLDAGGILSDDGAFLADIDTIVNSLQDRPFPPISFISPRMVPLRSRREAKDVSYYAIKSLSQEDSVRLAKRLLRDKAISVTEEQVSDFVELSDRHPYNFYAIMEEINEQGLSSFLANPRGFVEWKHRRYSDYLSKIQISDIDASLLGVLKILPTLDFTAIVEALENDASELSDALQRLIQLHIIEHSGDAFSISPPIRIAVEKDKRIRIPEEKRKEILGKLAESLSLRLDEGTAPITLIDTAVISSIEAEKDTYAAIFMLPSHYVFLCKRHYDQKHYSECIRLSKEALKDISRLSRTAMVTACRFMCLAAARMGDAATFNHGIKILIRDSGDGWIKSNIAFLRGFNERIKGHLATAEQYFREAIQLSPGNYSTARELSAICLARNNLPDAERFAREVHDITSSSVYILDILIAVLTRKLRETVKRSGEVHELMGVLKQVGDEGGHSFYTTRLAEIEFFGGDKQLARRLAEKAIVRTPNIFEPRRIYAEILLSEGNLTRAC
ncbi:toll/interleukin-1 receptor domain-containing protein [Komagataeibacter europaeus]|uniref:toll/interleukin-1 receptor domain-containing protein n=1 Tax=Komagataeibacter europaeus TaxID=33995 RepID=UPI0003075554|nr:toll/interleukin-1 receptor domain-containing protein [Komagataeibacter europaeus]GBQ45143.1 hypothetical protein AA18890_2371 [Komagataeibacter europaeus LMG 18890]